MLRALTRQPPFALFLAAAWLLVLVQLMAEYWPMTALSVHDADDAVRLAQVRAFLGGQGWFDLHEPRLSPPMGYDSHWSRLIDAGLAGLFLLFNAFVDGPLAERLMSAVWPVLWLVPTIGGAAAIAWRIGGREAAFVVLLLGTFGLPGMGQFRPGRIDHHNVQIALSVLAVAATVWSDRRRGMGWAAGALTALTLAIGFEALPLLVLCGCAFALRYVVDREAAAALRFYGLSLAAGMLAAFFVSVGPDHWSERVCDAIAINSAAAVAVAGLALALAASGFADERGGMRCAMVAAAAAAAASVFVLMEPRCLGGPFALMDPTLRSIWLAHNSEMQSLVDLTRKGPMAGIATAAFPALALVALALLAPRGELRRDFGFLVAGAAFLMASAVMLAAIKIYAYAMWLGVPLVAMAALDLASRFALHGMVSRFLLGLLVTPTTVTVGAMQIATAAGIDGLPGITSTERQACMRKDNYVQLAALPAGLLVPNELEWGAYLLAWTPHSVLAAPYHRLSASILTAHRVFAWPPEEARALLSDMRSTAPEIYVVTCGPLAAGAPGSERDAASLAARLQAGDIPDWLEPLPQVQQPFAAYRLKP